MYRKRKKNSVLTYFTKNFLIDRSENATLLNEYSMMPVINAKIEKTKMTSGKDKIIVRLYIKKEERKENKKN